MSRTRRLGLVVLLAISWLVPAGLASSPRHAIAALELQATPPSTILAPGSTTVSLTVTSSAATECRWSVNAPDRSYDLMTPFAGAGTTTHSGTVTGLNPAQTVVNDVTVRCAADPSTPLALKYRARAEGDPAYPRAGNLWGSWQFQEEIDANDPTRASKIDLWLGANFTPDQVAKLRAWNPDVLILGSINTVEMTVNDSVPDDYWLKDIHGNRIEVWPGAYRMNLTKPEVAEFMARYAYQQMADTGFTFDGIFFDNVFTSQSWWDEDIYGNPFLHDANEDGIHDDPGQLDAAWREGVLLELRIFRELMPHAIMSGHAQDITDPAIQAIFNSTSIGFDPPYVIEGRLAFATSYGRYYSWQVFGLPPTGTMIESAVPTQLGYGYGYQPWDDTPASTIRFGRTYYPYMRYGLAFTLMHDGYFAHEWGDTWHGNDWWYDEQELDLGKPLGPAGIIDLGSTPTVSQIVNGSFERPLVEAWTGYIATDEGAAAVIDRDASSGKSGPTALKVVVSQSSGTDWHVAVQQWNRRVVAGKSYNVSFWAKADAPRPLTVGMQKGGPDWRGYGLWDRVQLSTTWERYTVSFVASETANDALFQLFFGETTGTVWVDNVRIVERPPDVMRRDFEKGIVLLNATDTPRTVELGPGYKRFSGNQASKHQYIVDNNSANVNVLSGTWSTRVIDTGEWDALPPYYHDWGPNSMRGRRGQVEWDLGIPENGTYTVSAWWPTLPTGWSGNKAVAYEVISGGKVVASGVFDQRANGDRWNAIARIRLVPGAKVRLTCSGTLFCIVDALYVTSASRLNDGKPVSRVTIPPMDGMILLRDE